MYSILSLCQFTCEVKRGNSHAHSCVSVLYLTALNVSFLLPPRPTTSVIVCRILHWSVNKTVISASLFPPELFSKVNCFWIGLQLSWSQGKSIQTSVELTTTGSLTRLQSNHLLSLVSFLALELRFKERQVLLCMCFSPYSFVLPPSLFMLF